MQTSSGHASDPDELASFEGWLARALYRFDCPDAHVLGEYNLDLLAPEQRTAIAAHVVDCVHCASELALLREFLAMPTPVVEPLAQRVKRRVAALLRPAPGLALSGVRGGGDATTQIYTSEGVTITLAPGDESGELLGLVVAEGISGDELEGAEVRLLPEHGSNVVVEIDDLGNFAAESLRPGLYAIEIDLPADVIVVEGLRIA